MLTEAPQDEERWDEFFLHPAISFTNNTELRDMFEAVLQEDKRVTLFLGAGVSLDAGFPSWNRLISNMTSNIDKRWRSFVDQDPCDPMRKAEYVVRMVADDTTKTEGEVVRDALYESAAGESGGGTVANAVARLAAVVGDRLQIVTTNFDTLIESRLEEYVDEDQVNNFSLSEWRDVKNGTNVIPDHPTGKPLHNVVHVHGILEPNKSERGPLVLTESSFLQHGPDVRKLVKEYLVNTCVVFIGVSLTDPNLIGPLWDLKESDEDYVRPYALLVAAPEQEGQDLSDARAFAVKRSDYLSDHLSFGAVFLKSYAQISQVLHEMSLAAKVGRYLDESEKSLRYGDRLQTALNSCYTHLNCGPDEEVATGEHAEALGKKLHDALYEKGLVDEFRRHLDKLKSSNNSKRRKLVEDFGTDFEKENFGLFLWMRSRESGGREAEYTLNLVGTSVYTHRQPWSLDRTARIERYSRHAVARAAFTGLQQVQNMDDNREWQLWRGMIAVPFTVNGTTNDATLGTHPLDVLAVGGITLNTTNQVLPQAGSKAPRSALYTFTQPQLQQLGQRLTEIASTIVQPPA